MLFEKKYKIKDLYVAILARVTDIEYIPGKTFLDCAENYITKYDGPIGIFILNDKIATRLSTGVEYYYYNGYNFPRICEWYVKRATPLTHYVKFKEGITTLKVSEISRLEERISEKFYNKEEKNQTI